MGFVVLHMEKAHGSDSGTTAHIEVSSFRRTQTRHARTLTENSLHTPTGLKTVRRLCREDWKERG